MTDASPSYFRRLLADPAEPQVLNPDPSNSYEPTVFQEIPRQFPAEKLDNEAVRILDRLTDGGHQAYLVGGCVRDLLFGLRPKDFDVATSATPQEIKRLFRNCRIIGRRFRLAHIHFRDKTIEVATFRAACPPANGEENGELLIREDNVFGTAEEDARRRDFTFNALFYDTRRQMILDYVGGVADCENRMVRTIGDPHIRLREDPIRMLRAVRMAARLNCRIHPWTWEAIQIHAPEILRAAPPRILEDILRMFRGGAVAPAFDMMLESGMTQVVLPELHDHLAAEVRAGHLEEVEALRCVLRRADAWTQSGRELTTAVQLGLLLTAPLMTRLLRTRQEQGGVDGSELIASHLRAAAQRISISRKDSERLRLILLTMEKLFQAIHRGRKVGPALTRRTCFSETLDLFEMNCEATGDFPGEVSYWRHRLPPAPTREEGSPGRSYRRRRPRRRRPRG